MSPLCLCLYYSKNIHVMLGSDLTEQYQYLLGILHVSCKVAVSTDP